MTRITAAQNAQDIAELRSAVEALTVVVTALVPSAPAKPVAKKAPAKARKATAAKASPSKKVTLLRQANRKAVVKANPALQGKSCREIAALVKHENFVLKGGYAVGQGYLDLV